MLRYSSFALLLSLALCVSGSERLAASTGAQVIKVATLAPRESSFMREFERLDKRVREATQNNVQFRLYTSGVSGDEKDMLRKMRTGQLDAAMITSEGLALALPEVNVMRAPGVVTTYKQLEAVQNVLLPEFDASFQNQGYKLIAWGEAGEYRWFSRDPISKPADIHHMRPWLWPSSPIMKETWKAIGATPVPLGLGEVYGALQTKMVDLVESTAITYLAFQWHNANLQYMTEDTSGVLIGAWLMNKSMFDTLKPEWQELFMKLARADSDGNRARTRKADKQAYERLQERGHKLSKLTPEGKTQMTDIKNKVRNMMIGRIYSAELLHRVQTIAEANR